MDQPESDLHTNTPAVGADRNYDEDGPPSLVKNIDAISELATGYPATGMGLSIVLVTGGLVVYFPLWIGTMMVMGLLNRALGIEGNPATWATVVAGVEMLTAFVAPLVVVIAAYRRLMRLLRGEHPGWMRYLGLG